VIEFVVLAAGLNLSPPELNVSPSKFRVRLPEFNVRAGEFPVSPSELSVSPALFAMPTVKFDVQPAVFDVSGEKNLHLNLVKIQSFTKSEKNNLKDSQFYSVSIVEGHHIPRPLTFLGETSRNNNHEWKGFDMDKRETRRYDAFQRAKTFGQDNAADFAPGSKAAANFTTLNTVISGLDTAKAGQKPGKNTSKEVLLDAVRLDIQNITRTASAIAQDQPGFADAFRPPANGNEGVLLTTADKFLQQFAAQPALVPQFVAHEMAANFVTTLQTDRAAITAAQASQETVREGGVGSTATIGQLIAQGMKALTTLDAIMHNKYASQPDKMAAWLTAAHIERAAQHDAPAPAATPAPKA
jgi:hypothetical protein